MSKKRVLLHAGSLTSLIVPNLIYMGCNVEVLKEANAIALTMTGLLILSIVGLGALAHFKTNIGVWCAIIGVFILSLANVAYVAGIALIIEGGGLALDGYVFKPLLTKQKMEELKQDGEQITYTREIK